MVNSRRLSNQNGDCVFKLRACDAEIDPLGTRRFQLCLSLSDVNAGYDALVVTIGRQFQRPFICGNGFVESRCCSSRPRNSI
jgi:hypothetical protein